MLIDNPESMGVRLVSALTSRMANRRIRRDCHTAGKFFATTSEYSTRIVTRYRNCIKLHFVKQVTLQWEVLISEK